MKLLHKVTVLAIAAFGVASAHALPTIVTDWTYSIDTLWTDATGQTPVSGVGTQVLSWGIPSPNPGPQSSLTIGPAEGPAGLVDTYIGAPAAAIADPTFWAAANSLTHANNVIRVNTSLLTAELSSTLSLVANAPPGAPGTPGELAPPLTINIKFKETPNTAPCAVVGSPVPCNDIFTLQGGSLQDSFFYDVDGTGAQEYFVSVFPSSGGVLGVLPPNVCAAAGEDEGCIGFTTEELKENELAFSFVVSTQQIPEPGSLALVGFALLGAGMARRRIAKA
jgi:hypothetical protein